MKQSRWASFGETAVNTFAGFAISLGLQWLYFDWWLGFSLHFADNLIFAAIMTGVSLARGFTVRRIFEHFGLRLKLSSAAQAVLFERQRQKIAEGFDEAHDDKHEQGELARAGACYLFSGAGVRLNADGIRVLWPWTFDWWKPRLGDRRRDLVRGLALGLAELERFDRNRKPKVAA